MEPNKDKKPEKRSVRFIEGKGFYIDSSCAQR